MILSNGLSSFLERFEVIEDYSVIFDFFALENIE